MRNGAAVVGWLLLGESAETTSPFFFAAHFLILRNLANSLVRSVLRISFISVTVLSISASNVSVPFFLFFLDS